MTMLNNKPLLGYKFGDFVKFKYNRIVYNQEKGLPMYRDIEQFGWLQNTNSINGKVHIRSTHDHGVLDNVLRVKVDNILSKASWNGNIEDYPQCAPEGFQVKPPIFSDDPEIPRYAGGNIPIKPNELSSSDRVIPYNKSFDKKTKNSVTGLDAEIEKQKALISGKVIG